MKVKLQYLLLLALALQSCNLSKKVLYFQDPRHPQEAVYSTRLKDNYIRFQPEDVLSISVNIPSHQEIATYFNMPIQAMATTHSSGDIIDSGFGRQTYEVDRDGCIMFPILGKLQIAGYTREELEEKMRAMISGYLKDEKDKGDVLVTIKLMNFKIYFLGEKGGALQIDKDHINIFEALSMGGDLGMTSKRHYVLLSRPMPEGKYHHVRLDLTKIDILSSPYFYLHQNDMLYIEPSKLSTQQLDVNQWNFYLSIITTLTSVISIYLFYRALDL
jgi:polysaccharide export outer membrane protein